MFWAPSRVPSSWEMRVRRICRTSFPLRLSRRASATKWFVDDGQCFVRPMLFDRWLRALDSALASYGATRGRIVLGNAKCSARLLCPPERIHELSGWDTA